jgi:tRNA/rRNA methyltransferase
MNNTGYKDLRLIMDSPLSKQAYKTAVHSEEILKKALLFPHLSEAVQDIDVVFAAAARHRKNFSSLKFDEAVEKMICLSSTAKTGLLFGNERTGLISEELRHSNFRFSLPQANEQPSYNLASAVLLILFQLFLGTGDREKKEIHIQPISREKQEQCMDLIVQKLENKDFIHQGNREHVTDMLYDLFGRLTMTEKDRNLLMAVFSK